LIDFFKVKYNEVNKKVRKLEIVNRQQRDKIEGQTQEINKVKKSNEKTQQSNQKLADDMLNLKAEFAKLCEKVSSRSASSMQSSQGSRSYREENDRRHRNSGNISHSSHMTTYFLPLKHP